MNRTTHLAAVLALGVYGASYAGQPASNDPNNPEASFAEGMFSLPELKSPKDWYIIIVEPQSAGESVKLSLPPGSLGIRVSKAALPPGQWTWKYKVVRESPPPLSIATAKDVELGTPDLIDGKYSLVWSPVPGAKKYLITGQSRTKSSPDDNHDRKGVSSTWRFGVDYLERDKNQVNMPDEGIPVAVVVTISDPEGKVPVFDEMRASLLRAGLQMQDIRTAIRNRART
jgi:hypothetical protein